MSRLPGVQQLFGKNRISSKLMLIVSVLLIPALVLGYLLYSNIGEQVDFAKGELTGAEYFNASKNAVSASVEHRKLVAEYLTGQTQGPDLMKAAQAKVEESMKKIEEVDARLTAQTKQTHTDKANKQAAEAWKVLIAKLYNAKPGDAKVARETLEVYDKFVQGQLEQMIEAADGSKLTLDPEYGSYGLMSVSQQIIGDLDLVGKVHWRALLAATSKDKSVTFEHRADIARLLGLAEKTEGDVASAMEDIVEEKLNTLTTLVNPKLDDWKKKRGEFFQHVTDEVVVAEKVEITAEELANTMPPATSGASALYDVTSPLLVKELDTRLAGFRRTLTLGGMALFLGLALAAGLVYFVTRGFTMQIKAFTDLFTAVDQGNYSVRVAKFTSDELGDMSMSLNQVLNTTDNLIAKQKKDYDELQVSIMRLLDDVSGTADGDLSKEAEVTADATGAIADSFNFMIAELRKVIGNVQNATLQVSSSANEIYTSAEHLADGSENQSEQIVNTSAAIDEMAVSIQQVSENAATSTSVAQQALATAKQGNIAVRNTIEGMNKIREQAQETAKRIKRLGETSQEIGQIVQLIDDIADRTSILALNASIQAAAAGEAGRGFAVVAEEVERLAVRSTEATKKIATLVKAIQGETNEAVGAMEKNIQEVVNGSKVANQAGQSLNEIEGVSLKLAELIQSISLASKQQARGSEALAKSMGDISQITQQTAAGTKQTAESVNALARLADDLRGSVSMFKLPAGYGNKA